MKTVILYGRRNTAQLALAFLVAKGFNVKVITLDPDLEWLAHALGCEITTLEKMGKDFDLFICCHGQHIIPKQFLVNGKMINIHPCLNKYPGHNPIKKYIENKDTIATVSSQYLIEEVDAGKLIYTTGFTTGEISTYEAFYNIAYIHYYKCLNMTLKLLNI